MRPTSLFTRVIAATIAAVSVTAMVAGFGLTEIFDQAIARRALNELRNEMRFLAGELRSEANGQISLERNPADPRYEQPYGGRYWQIEIEGYAPVRSRSLWDTTVTLTESVPKEGLFLAFLTGPAGQILTAFEQSITIPSEQDLRTVRVAVGFDRSEWDGDRRAFLRLLVPSLAALMAIFMIAMFVFQRLALRPLVALRTSLAQVHDDKAGRVEGRFPTELQPLVDDLNHLIGHGEAALQRARAQAGELAHGLKTPLAVLDALAREQHVNGSKSLATEIRDQVDQMNRHVRHALARARMALRSPVRERHTPVRPTAEKIIKALSRLPDANRITWQIEIPEKITAPLDVTDLTEILGNLLDNARKCARQKIVLRGCEDGRALILDIDDDGAGMPRADETRFIHARDSDHASGNGLGLTIVRDLAETIGGRLELSRSDIGGLRARVIVPRGNIGRPAPAIAREAVAAPEMESRRT